MKCKYFRLTKVFWMVEFRFNYFCLNLWLRLRAYCPGTTKWNAKWPNHRDGFTKKFNLSQMLNKDKSRAQKWLNYKYKSNRMSMSVCVCRRILTTTKPIWFFLKLKLLIIEVLGVFMLTLVIILPPKKNLLKNLKLRLKFDGRLNGVLSFQMDI